jgi:hypothetical protein
MDQSILQLTQFRFGNEPKDEIEAIRRLDASIQGIQKEGGPPNLTPFTFLEEIKRLHTRHYNKEFIDMLPNLAIHHKGVILEILVNTRDPGSEALLNGLLESKIRSERALAARGLAKLNALESPISISDPSEADSIELAEIMSSTTSGYEKRRITKSKIMLLAKSKIPRVRKDLAKILLELHDGETSEIFLKLATDSNEEVAIEVLSHLEKLPKQLAKDILQAALTSSHPNIVTMAEVVEAGLNGFQP